MNQSMFQHVMHMLTCFFALHELVIKTLKLAWTNNKHVQLSLTQRIHYTHV